MVTYQVIFGVLVIALFMAMIMSGALVVGGIRTARKARPLPRHRGRRPRKIYGVFVRIR